MEILWFVVGLVATATIIGFIWFIRSKNISIRWYEWLMGIIGFALLLYTFIAFTEGIIEGESLAAVTFLWTLGVPALILLAIPSILVINRSSAKE